MSEDLWERVYAALEDRPDATPQAALNRIARKCLRLKKPRTFDPSNCTVREERLSLNDLRTLERFHSRSSPRRIEGPLVVICMQGRRVLVDGHNRVAKWLKAGDAQVRTALVLHADGCHQNTGDEADPA